MANYRRGIPASIIKAAFSKAGGRCAFPECQPLVLDNGTPLLELALISSLAPGSLRYDPGLTPEERVGIDNIIILCPTHHAYVDKNPEKYSAKTLRAIRETHFERVETALSGVESPGTTSRRLTDALKIWEDNRDNSSEQFWQEFLAERPEVLILALDGRAYTLSSRCYVGGKSIHNSGGNELDFLAQYGGNVALIEIKTPKSDLLAPTNSASLRRVISPGGGHLRGVKLGEVERLRGELAEFVADVLGSLPRRDQRRWGDCYLRGLMLDGRRKSIQPMAERLPDGNMQALQQFVNQSPWDPLPVRRRIAQRLCEAIRPEVWVVDDVSFPKCGTASVGVARQYCGALGKRANCQVAVSVHAATDTASCPLEWELFLPQEWAHDDGRRQRAGIPVEVGHVSKTHLALGLLDRLAGQGLAVPVIVADAGYGRSVSFRLALEERAWTYVMAVDPKEIARPADAEPYQPAYGGLGPPTLPRYREKPCPLPGLVDETAVFEEVTWRQGSKGAMTSHFAVLPVRPSGKEACRTAQEQAGGRSRWDGVLPLRTLLVERPEEADEPTGYWMTNLPATTPIADLVRWAKMRWRIEHDYRELKHGLGLDHFEGRTWRGWHHHVTLVTAAQAFLTLRRLDPKAQAPA